MKSAQKNENLTQNAVLSVFVLGVCLAFLNWHNAYFYIDDVSITESSSQEPLFIAAGQKYIFDNILFEPCKSTLQSSSFAQLDQIAVALK